jgi:signal peptidase I
MRTLLREILGTIILAVVVFLLLQTTVQSFIVDGYSMENSFHDGQRLIVVKDAIAYAFHEPEMGDVTVFHPPGNRQGDYIKRIIALPGDTVEVREGAVYVNGKRLYEPYVKDPPDYTLDPIEVPENKYFVLGDNRNNSNDSHNGWMVPRQNILGRAWLSIWPPDEWGLAPNYNLKKQLAGS